MNYLSKRRNNQKLWPVYVSDKNMHEEPDTLRWFLLERLKANIEPYLIKEIYHISDECSAPFTTISTAQKFKPRFFDTTYSLRFEDITVGHLSIGIGENATSDWERAIQYGRIQNFIQESLNPIKIGKEFDTSSINGHYSIRIECGLETETTNGDSLLISISMTVSLETWKILLSI